MDTILTVDVSQDKARALLVEVAENELKLISEVKSEADLNSALDEIFDALGQGESKDLDEEVDSDDDQDSSSEEPDESAPSIPGKKLADIIAELVGQIDRSWVSAVLIIPSCDYLSLNVPLPFGDDKSINRVIDLEVQDLVPFSVDEFHVNHCVVSEEHNGEHDVHVGMMPRAYIKSVLSSCSMANFEPSIVSTQTSTLAAMYHLAPDYMAKNSAVVYMDSKRCYICLAIDGRVKTDRIIFGGALKSSGSVGLESSELIRDLKLSITSVEKRYGVTIAKVYLVGSDVSPNQLQQSLGRSVEEIHADEFIKAPEDSLHSESHLVGLSAVFARDVEPPAVLANFRSREFSYNPQIQQLKKFVRQVSPHLTILAVLTLLYFATLYGMRSYKISSLESAIGEEIRKVAPHISAQSGDELSALSAENSNLGNELAQLGAPGKFSALDSLLALSKDLNRVKKRDITITVNEIIIETNMITLDGQAPDYPSRDILYNVLEDNKSTYCNIAGKNTGTNRNAKFTIKLKLCEL